LADGKQDRAVQDYLEHKADSALAQDKVWAVAGPRPFSRVFQEGPKRCCS